MPDTPSRRAEFVEMLKQIVGRYNAKLYASISIDDARDLLALLDRPALEPETDCTCDPHGVCEAPVDAPPCQPPPPIPTADDLAVSAAECEQVLRELGSRMVRVEYRPDLAEKIVTLVSQARFFHRAGEAALRRVGELEGVVWDRESLTVVLKRMNDAHAVMTGPDVRPFRYSDVVDVLFVVNRLSALLAPPPQPGGLET